MEVRRERRAVPGEGARHCSGFTGTTGSVSQVSQHSPMSLAFFAPTCLGTEPSSAGGASPRLFGKLSHPHPLQAIPLLNVPSGNVNVHALNDAQ